MTTTVKHRVTGEVQVYQLPPAEALVSAAMLEDNLPHWLTDDTKRQMYRGFIIGTGGKLRLTAWEVITKEQQ